MQNPPICVAFAINVNHGIQNEKCISKIRVNSLMMVFSSSGDWQKNHLNCFSLKEFLLCNFHYEVNKKCILVFPEIISLLLSMLEWNVEHDSLGFIRRILRCFQLISRNRV